jgi:hypothetical protein
MQPPSSPIRPVAPPLKKQRASGTPAAYPETDNHLDRAMAISLSQRRSDLLQMRQRAAQTSAVIGMAQAQLQESSSLRGTGGRTIPPPQGSAMARVRHSDIFPSVPKLAPENASAKTPSLLVPRQSLARRLDASFNPHTHTAGSNTAQLLPMPPTTATRSKSAPPRPRPQPPPRPPAVPTPALADKRVSFDSVANSSVVVPRGQPQAEEGPLMFYSSSASPRDQTPREPTKSRNALAPAGSTPFHSTTTHASAGTPMDEPTTKLHAGHTPFPFGNGQAMDTPSLETSPELISSLAMSTASSYSESPELRLHKELLRSEKEKADLYSKVATLEDEIKKFKQTAAAAVSVSSPDIANSSPTKRAVTFLSSSESMVMGTPLASRAPIRQRRLPTPHPKKGDKNGRTRQEMRILLEKAAETTQNEYETENMATFFVRRPYGRETNRELWLAGGQLLAKQYELTADAYNVKTLEVVAEIAADGSLLVLYGDGAARHQMSDGSTKEFAAGEQQSLGPVMYIDSYANEREYSLEAVLQGALAVREHYCSAFYSVLSTIVRSTEDGRASSVEREDSPAIAKAALVAVAAAKVPTRDTGVGTDDNPFAEQGDKAEVSPKLEVKENKKKRNVPSVDEELPSSGVLGTFAAMLGNAIVGVLWFWFVRLPVRLVQTVIIMLSAVLVLTMLHVYMADDRGAGAMGAYTCRGMYNPPGIF